MIPVGRFFSLFDFFDRSNIFCLQFLSQYRQCSLKNLRLNHCLRFYIAFFLLLTKSYQVLQYSKPKLNFVGNKAKGRISKWMFQENKAGQIFRKTNISYPLISTRTCAYQGVRNVRFSEILACFVSLKDSFWDSPFWLITDNLIHRFKYYYTVLKLNIGNYATHFLYISAFCSSKYLRKNYFQTLNTALSWLCLW